MRTARPVRQPRYSRRLPSPRWTSRRFRNRRSAGFSAICASIRSTRQGTRSPAPGFLASILDAEGIPYEIVESAPGRGNIWARLKGGGEPALILLHHMDVVPADRRFWKTDPLVGRSQRRIPLRTRRAGYEVERHPATSPPSSRCIDRRSRLKRDVIFMATADEEAGGEFGVGWLVKNRPELFKGVGAVINEGGGGQLAGGQPQFGIEVTQKVPYWFHLTARDEPGHGSRPRETSSVTKLVAALERLRQHEFEVRIIPGRGCVLQRHGANGRRRSGDRDTTNMAAALRTPGVIAELQRDNPGAAFADSQHLLDDPTRGQRQDQRRFRPKRGPRSTAGCCPIRIRSSL